jgi:hypothetical protein
MQELAVWPYWKIEFYLEQVKIKFMVVKLEQIPKRILNYVLPLDDPENVDQRRAAVGLQPLADYISHWNLTWDVEAYKKELPDLIEKENRKK